MTREEMKYLDDRFNSQKELFEVLIGDINKRLDTIVKQNDVRNHRIEKSEDEIIKITQGCQFVQTQKEKKAVFQRWLIGTLVFAVGVWLTWHNIKAEKKVPVELFYQKTDSTMHVPRMYLRDDKTGSLREVHIDYLDIQ